MGVMSGPTDSRYPYAHRTAARTGGALMLTGGSLAIVLLAVGPGFVHGKTVPTLSIGSLAIVVGLLCVVRPARVPAWFLPALGPFGVVLIGMSSVLTRTATDGSELLYMWTVLYAAYFVPLRYAVIDVVLIAAVYPPIAVRVLGTHGITPSVYLVGTSFVTLMIVSNLRRQLTRVLTETAREARTDALTGLANRRSWNEELAREIARQDRAEHSLAVLLIDLDHFKRLNDTYGHAAGDTALAGVAAVLRGQARQSDVLARVGGEEFGLLLAGCPLGVAVSRADGIRKAVEETSARWRTPVTISVGVAALSDRADSGEALMAAADAALYTAKGAGRNTVRAAG
jgi:diguanylate cyclase (GGDEF)-like protein